MNHESTSETQPEQPAASLWTKLQRVGPAIIIASVVLGPGSIVTNSKVGWQYGYAAIWVLALACLLMMAMTALAMRVGVALKRSPCDELAASGARWFAVTIGIALFLVAASFQFSNNLGILFAFEPFFEVDAAGGGAGSDNSWNILLLLGLNAIVIVSLLLARNLYAFVESAMKWLVGLMLLAFATNLLITRPSFSDILLGFIPNLAAVGAVSSAGSNTGLANENLFILLGLVATTFSVGAAFYQAYLVRQRGWGVADLQTGGIDSIVGIAALGCMSLMIMVTAATAFHQNPEVTQLNTAADVARQLRPLFGPMSTLLFCMGVLAGALSSFLVNSMIGGCVLSDGLGFGSNINERGPRVATVASLLIGMSVAIATKGSGYSTASLIVFAQAITVVGNPLLAGAILWLASKCRRADRSSIPLWFLLGGYAGMAVVLVLSIRTVISLLGR